MTAPAEVRESWPVYGDAQVHEIGPDGFGFASDPEVIAGAVRRFEDATRGQVRWYLTGAQTSDGMLRRSRWGRGPEWCEAPPGGILRQGGAAVAKSPLDYDPEALAQWLVRPLPAAFDVAHLDLNGQYLSACSSVTLPVGPVGLVRASVVGEVERHPACLVCVDVTGRPWDLRAPWRRGEAHAWLTTPALRYALEYGYLVRATPILEGFGWGDTCRGMEGWYRTLREAREFLLGLAQVAADDRAALEAVKMIYRQGIGRMMSPKRARGEADPLYLPAWRSFIIDNAKQRMGRALHNAGDLPILATDVDSAWVVLPQGERSPLPGERSPLPLGPRLGQWKQSARYPLQAARDGAKAEGMVGRAGLSATALLGALQRWSEGA